MIRLAPLVLVVLALTGCAPQPVDPLVQQEIDVAWEVFEFSYPGVERPDVAIVELVDIRDQQQRRMDCAREAGFDWVEQADGSYSYEGDDAQDAMLAMYVCKAQYPADPASLRP